MSGGVLILGGGPAGLVAAIGLARSGWPVTVLSVPGRGGVEGLSARVAEGFRVAGCEAALAVLGAPLPRHARWNGEAFSVGAEFVVERRRLDAALAEDAQRTGVTIEPARARSVARGDAGWTVMAVGPGGAARRHEAAFLIEARGRAAPTDGTTEVRGPETIALAGTWRIAPGGEGFTAVAGFRNGWAWCARREGWASFTVLLDGGRGAAPARSALAVRYAETVRAIPCSEDWLGAGAELVGVTVRDATARLVEPVIGASWLRLGDAGFTIDPLSGHGIYEAVRAALTVPALVNTLVNRPADADLALRFHRDRADDSFRRHARTGRDLYAQETNWADAPFWAARRNWGAGPQTPPGEGRIAWRPVLEDGWIVGREVLVTPDHPLGVWRLGETPIVPMLRRRGTKSVA